MWNNFVSLQNCIDATPGEIHKLNGELQEFALPLESIK